MAGMWELPEIPCLTHERARKSGAVSESIGGSGGKHSHPLRFASGRNDKGAGRGKPTVLLFTVRHSITVTDYTVRVWKSSLPGDVAGRWIAFSRLPKLAMTGLARKILTKASVMPTRARASFGGVTLEYR